MLLKWTEGQQIGHSPQSPTSPISPPTPTPNRSPASPNTTAPPVNDVELSVVYLSKFPLLTARQSMEGRVLLYLLPFLSILSFCTLIFSLPFLLALVFDPLESIARSCIVRKLTTAEAIKILLPNVVIVLPPPTAAVSFIIFFPII